MEQERDILISELETLTESLYQCEVTDCVSCEKALLRVAIIAGKLREAKEQAIRPHIPEDCIPGIFKDVRAYFIANYLDGETDGVITVKAEFLADDIADLFSNEEWVMDQMRTYFVTVLRWED